MLKPMKNRVLVTLPPRPDAERGLIIPDIARRYFHLSKVLAKGPKCTLDLEIGELVLFNPVAGTQVNVNGEECLVLEEKDVWAVCPPEIVHLLEQPGIPKYNYNHNQL